MSFQIFVVGLEGKTSTLNDITAATKVSVIKDKMHAKVGIRPNEQRLIFAGKQLDEGKTVEDYGIQKHSTINLVVRLPGGATPAVAAAPPGEKRHDPDDDLELTDAPDIITWDDDPDNLRAKMPCGHAIGPESLTAFCRSLVSDGKFQFFCPYISPTDNSRCSSEWQYIDIRKYGLLTDEERDYFEKKISENYALRAFGVQECPKCSTCCERGNKSIASVVCIVCSRKPKAKEFAFCWYCRSEVKGRSGYRCRNKKCGGIDSRLAILKNAPKKTVGRVEGVPCRRACPNCGTIIEHDRACKHMKCRCDQQFCFICLVPRHPQTGWRCGQFDSPCEIAAVQTAIPGM